MSRIGVVCALIMVLVLVTAPAWAVSFYPLPQAAEKGVAKGARVPTAGVAIMSASWQVEVRVDSETVSDTASGVLLTGQFALGKDWVVGGAVNSIGDGVSMTITEGNLTYRLPGGWGAQAGLVHWEGGYDDYLACAVKSFRGNNNAWQADLGLGWYSLSLIHI